MKLLTISNYISDDSTPQFRRNKTGYGYIVRDIVCELSLLYDVSLFTYSGNYKFFRYKNIKVLGNEIFSCLRRSRFIDYVEGVNFLVRHRRYKKEALRVFYSYLTRGYLQREIKNNDVIHIHGCTPNLIPYVELSLNENKNTLVTLHGLNSFSNETKASDFVRKSEKKLLSLLKGNENLKISVLTPAAKELICNHLDLDMSNNQITIIPNFIESDKKKKLENKIDINTPKLILYVGNLSEQKNQKALLKTIACNLEKYKGRFKFLFIGEICDDFRREVDFFRDKIDLVEFTGHVPREEMERYYTCCSLVVLLSKVEGFGLSIIEGFSFGVPCLINRDMEISSLLDENDFIHRIDDVNNTSKVHEALEKALSEGIDKDKIISYSKRFEIKNVINNYISLLDS